MAGTLCMACCSYAFIQLIYISPPRAFILLNSLETRAVFLDNDVVEFCQRLPNHFKYRKGARKYLLKKAMRGVLPPAILARRKKGFGIPLTKWLREVPLYPPLAPIDGIMTDWVARQWREHRQGAADHRLFLWSWLSLQALLAAPMTAGTNTLGADLIPGNAPA